MFVRCRTVDPALMVKAIYEKALATKEHVSRYILPARH
jgi:hypothetical protein